MEENIKKANINRYNENKNNKNNRYKGNNNINNSSNNNTSNNNKNDNDNHDNQIRLQKFIAESGIASRRKAEQMIEEGKIEVNGKIIKEQGVKVNPKTDVVKIIDENGDKKKIEPEKEKIYILLNKPIGYVTTVKDQFERDTVMDLLKNIKERVVPVGRLDMYTSGALILSNDGDFINKITHPKHEINKTYNVTVKGSITEEDVQKLRDGVEIKLDKLDKLGMPNNLDSTDKPNKSNNSDNIDGISKLNNSDKANKQNKLDRLNESNKEVSDKTYITKPAKVKILKIDEEKNISRLQITIHEGKNRQIRKMCEGIGKRVIALHRAGIGNIRVKDLPLGEYRFLSEKEVEELLREK